MDLRTMKETIKGVEAVADPCQCAITPITISIKERSDALEEAVDLISQVLKINSLITDPREQRHIHFDNWTKLLRLDMEMAQFLRRLRV